MKHIVRISRPNPLRAQFAPVIEFTNMISTILGLLEQLAEMFGFEIPQKQ